jgi:signal transduction histidine kinase
LDEPGAWLATLPATAQQRRRAFAAVAVLFALLLAAAPFARVRLPEGDGFIPFVQAVIVITDLIAAALLFTQFSLLRWRALLALAIAYLFTATIVFVHTLTFPRVFAPQGLLVTSLQTTGWLYLIWRLSFPIGVIAYLLLSHADDAKRRMGGSPLLLIGCSLAGVPALVGAILWFLTTADRLLPTLFTDRLTFSPAVSAISAFGTAVSGIALFVLLIREGSALDQWLMVSVGATAAELTMVTFFSGGRFDLGWYCIRIFGVVSSTAVLIGLLSETTRLYAKLSIALGALQRERDNKLLSAQASTAAIAHEIRQPLTAIAANASAARRLLQQASPNLGEVREALEETVEGCHRASGVIEGVRRLFLGAGRGGEPIDLNGLILEVLQANQEQLKRGGVETRRELQDGLPPVRGDRAQLHEVVANLVNNAVEAMEGMTDRDRRLTVKTAMRGRNAIAVEIQDTGPGIDPSRLGGIFSAFVTTKTRGTGLGLAICQMIVENHGGTLTANSDGASGARFAFVLPRMAMEGAADPGPRS